ncbi:Ja186 [Japanese cytomegalovirus]|nr:Ja186 [Japanese cytomegalovirus]
MPRSPELRCRCLLQALLLIYLFIVPAESCNKICKQKLLRCGPESGIPDGHIYGYTELDPVCNIENGRLHVNGIVLGDFSDPTWLHVYLRNQCDGKFMFAFSTNSDHPVVIMNNTLYRRLIHPMELLEEAKSYNRDHGIVKSARLEHVSRLRYQFDVPVSYLLKDVVIQVDHYYKPLFIKCQPEHELTDILKFYLLQYGTFHTSRFGKLYWICLSIVYLVIAKTILNLLIY